MTKKIVANRVKHGKWGSPEYWAWASLRQRCLNPANPQFHDYGGRGITVCPEWANDFMAFYNHGPRPSPRYSIDRKDNNKGYEPGNVRWAVRGDQQRNRRNNVWITVGDETLCRQDWANRLGYTETQLANRLKRLPVQDAIKPASEATTPKRGYGYLGNRTELRDQKIHSLTIDGMSGRQVAEAMGVSRSLVCTTLRRLRR